MIFPKDFFWGAATASYQVEGGIENNDWAAAARAKRVPLCGVACDHFNRYEADFDLAVALGHNAHRFSIEWARIEPVEGEFDPAAIAHYRDVLRALNARNLEPFVTLWHFTLPEWLAAKGGFECSAVADYFARYARYVVTELGDEFTYVATMNEPVVFASLGWLKGNWPPFKQFRLVGLREYTHSGDRALAKPSTSFRNLFQYRRVVRNLVRTHRAAYTAIKSVRPELSVSLVKHVVAYDADTNPLHRIRAWIEDQFFNHIFLRRVVSHCDMIGLNFYHYVKFGNRPKFTHSDMGWEMAPFGIYHALKTLSRYKKPIYVSEAGVADHDDSHRSWYIQEQIRGVEQALTEGIDVRAHLYWSLMDNYEWALGFEKKFGLIEINYETQARVIRPSAWVYKQLITEKSAVE